MEDRIWSNKPLIKPASKYVDELHVYYDTTHGKEPKKPFPSYTPRDKAASWVELYEKDKKEYLSDDTKGMMKWGFRNLSGFNHDLQNEKKGSPALHKLVTILKKNKWEAKDFYDHVREKWTNG